MRSQPERARLLMLTPVMPADRGSGLAMRAGFFLDAYAHGFDVDLAVIPVAGAGPASAFVRSRVRRLDILAVGWPDSHYALLASIADPAARLDAFRRYGRPSLAAFVAPARRTLEQWVGDVRYDAVHVFRLYLAELVSPWRRSGQVGPRLILDCDENDARTYRRIAAMERRRPDLQTAAWADAEAAAFARAALDWLPKFDVALAASRREATSLAGFGVRTLVVANVAPATAMRPRRRRRPPTILFVGTLAYPPNADAVNWFVTRVWRRLQRHLKFRARLVIVGRNPPAAITRLRSQRGIDVTGTVADVADFYREADLAIVPLRAGGGTRIKIIEAAAYGVPVVATGLGAEGTTFQHGRDMLVADDADGFLRACLLLIRNGARAKRLAAHARARSRRDYSPAYWRTQVLHAANAGDVGGF